MEIRILLAGEQVGPFSETQVRQYLGDGVVSPSDLALREGVEEWQPLDRMLAELPAPPRAPDAVPSGVIPPDSPAADQTPETPLARQNDAFETVEPSVPPPVAGLSPTASQKTKRKLSKIVIQPILPLEPTAPLQKKLRTGKTALTLEPLRPTTSLPPVTGFMPKEKKNGRNAVRTGPLSLRNFSEKKTVPAPVVSPKPPLVAMAPPKPAPLASNPSPSTPLLPEKGTRTPLSKAGPRPIPREIIYAGSALAFILTCLVLSLAHLVSKHPKTPSPDHPAAPKNVPPAPTQAAAQNAEAIPKTAADFSNRGVARQAKGDLDGAIADYNQALALEPKNAEAFYRRGLARQARGDFDRALADYTRVIDLNPREARAYSNRAFIKQAQGDGDGALADYNEALLIDPKIPRAFYNIGLIQVQKGDLDGAIAAYDHAIDLDPKMAIAYYNRGVAKNTEGNLDGAIADYTRALDLNPQIARAYCDRGFARQSKGDSDGALADYAQTLALNPKMTAAFYNRGLIKAQKGDLNGAVADNTQAIALDPKNGPAYYNRGLARIATGDLAPAMADLRKFCELAPRENGADTARLYIWLISAQQNPQGGADEELSTALQNDWNSPPEELTSKIAAFLLGHISENDLIANAASPDPSREPGQYCKAWYFAGMKRLLGGDPTTATAYFQKCMATEQKDACEYIFARAQLQALGQNRELAARPESGP